LILRTDEISASDEISSATKSISGVEATTAHISYPTFGREVLTIDEFLGAIEPARNDVGSVPARNAQS
jgi:hypothetical protein